MKRKWSRDFYASPKQEVFRKLCEFHLSLTCTPDLPNNNLKCNADLCFSERKDLFSPWWAIDWLNKGWRTWLWSGFWPVILLWKKQKSPWKNQSTTSKETSILVFPLENCERRWRCKILASWDGQVASSMSGTAWWNALAFKCGPTEWTICYYLRGLRPELEIMVVQFLREKDSVE